MILPLIEVTAEAFTSLPIILRIVLLTAALFLPVNLILGMVTPVVIKLHLRDLARTGNVVGRFYAVSTAGSILGVFLTGFVLIQWIGTRPIVLSVAIFLFGMALLFGDLWKVRFKLPALAAVGIASLFTSLSFALARIHRRDRTALVRRGMRSERKGLHGRCEDASGRCGV